MTRREKRQEKRAQEEKRKREELEAKGFTFSTLAYHEKRNISNKKCSVATRRRKKKNQPGKRLLKQR